MFDDVRSMFDDVRCSMTFDVCTEQRSIRTFVRSFVRARVGSLVRSFVRSFIRACVHARVCSFIVQTYFLDGDVDVR